MALRCVATSDNPFVTAQSEEWHDLHIGQEVAVTSGEDPLPLSMSTSPFGLQTEPFGMTPDPAMLYLTPGHLEALAGLTYAIIRRKGFIALTGDAGTGKTTLLARVLQHFPPERVLCSKIVNPKLTGSEFLEMALAEWGITNPPESKTQRLLLLRKLLLTAKSEGKIVVLVVDEAHALSANVLEELRLLGNFEEAEQKLLQIILAGQSELTALLNREDLRQIKQRIAVKLNIERLSDREVEGYIRFRWTKACGTKLPFSLEAIGEVARHSGGIPRVINVICSNALTLMTAEDLTTLGPDQIREACANLDLAPPPVPAAPNVMAQPPVSPNGSAGKDVSVPEVALGQLESDLPFKTFERYTRPAPKRLLARWVARFRG